MGEMTALDKCREALTSMQQLDNDISKLDISNMEPVLVELSLYAIISQMNELMDTVTKVLRFYIKSSTHRHEEEVTILHKVVTMDDILRTRINALRNLLKKDTK